MANTYHKAQVDNYFGSLGVQVNNWFLMYQGVADLYHLFQQTDDGKIERLTILTEKDIEALLELFGAETSEHLSVQITNEESHFLRNYDKLKNEVKG